MYNQGGYDEGPYGGPPSPADLSTEELIQSVDEVRHMTQSLRGNQIVVNEKMEEVEAGIERLSQDDGIDKSAWALSAFNVAYTVAMAEGIGIQFDIVILFVVLWLAYWSAPSQWQQ